MPTVVNLTEQELADLKVYTNQTDDAAAVRTAMKEFLRFARRMRLKSMSGQVTMEENWQELEVLELKPNNGSSGPGSA